MFVIKVHFMTYEGDTTASSKEALAHDAQRLIMLGTFLARTQEAQGKVVTNNKSRQARQQRTITTFL